MFSKKALFKRYYIAHIYYTKSWKRLLGYHTYLEKKISLISFLFFESVLHTIFFSTIAYLSIMIDENNSIVAQRLLSPFFGGIF